ncbi:EAL domain-containing protein [Emcibacteraceae bacterium]|nr:EAL domain-containing protein [Emcibacteraceae bacterium]
MMFLLAVRLVIYRASFKSDFYVKSNKWLLIYTGITFLLGVMWGLVTLIPVDYLQGELLTLTLVTLLLALCCISAISSSAHTYVIWAFLIPIAIFSTVYLINANSEEYGTIMGIGALTFCVVAGLIGQSLHRMILSALFLQNRNSLLMDEVVQIAKQNQKSYEGFQLLLDNLGAGAAMFDRNRKMISWNKSFENIFNLPTGLIKRGMTLKEVIRKIIKQSWQGNVDVNHAADAHIKEILQEKNEDDLVKLVLADGRNLYSKVMKISDDQLVLNYTDVTSLEQARTDDIIHVLQHDSLTGLPNQVLHKKEVRKRIVDFRREAAKNEKLKDEQFMALVYFGLNSLNEIYEFLGLSAGDQVVTEIANRCKEFFQDDVHLSHVAYDEFHIITSNENNLNEVLELVEELNKILAAPIKIGENSIEMTISVGISIYPDHADKTDHINRNAKIAYNKAMLTNAYSVVVYEHGMHSEIMERTNMLFDIRDSISKSQFLLHYQPQINIDNRQINGVEALLRWQHPDKGWISPDDFIPLAEHTKQIIPLTEQFLPEACYQAKKWQDQGLEPFKMAVNISPFHFHEKDFPKFVRNCLEAVKLDPEYFDLEITEGVIMNQTEEIIRILHELSEMGVQLSIDDFGTGYSSLSYLRRLPVDKLKIDQSFIRDMDQDKSAHSLVEAIIRLGHSFNLNVIAEGVETEDQLKKLATMRCDQAQGFYIKRPDTADEITKWIKSNNA